MVTPSAVTVSGSKSHGDRSYKGVLRDAIFVGASTRYLVDTELGSAVISTKPDGALTVGDSVVVSWDKNKEFLVR